MNLLAFSPTECALDESLESMHAESEEWLKEIDFWRDEIIFFNRLMYKHKQETKRDIPTQELAAIERDMIFINRDKLDLLRNDAYHHEQMLSSILQSVSFHDEELCRRKHRELLRDISSMHLLIRNFKSKVFSIIPKK
ncbi:MAG TPA: hypothetical protein PLJ60_21375 [Chryseolinea sp.]|nr:hypothetical protein [Chryseolinea sp.]HPM32899.1 hypothetical protein [Chryseolinea sp.]